jgi:DNA-binding NarL/FixJ family response regulator
LEEEPMNATSTKFAAFGDFAALGTVPQSTAAVGAAGAAMFSGRTQPKHHTVLSAVPDSLRSNADGESLSLAAALRKRYPSSPVVVLLLSDQSDQVLRAIGFSAAEGTEFPWSDHLTADSLPASTLATGDQLALVSKTNPAPLVEHASESRAPTARSLGLTDRQLQVLALMAQGKPNKLICRELRLAEGTVKCHVSAILRALDVGTRTQAALKATRLGLGVDKAAASLKGN